MERRELTMCSVLEQFEQKSIEKGEKLGIGQGIMQRDRELIHKWTALGYKTHEIADLLGRSEEEVRVVQAEK
ncbi:MAG: hypothetical protein LUD12_10835 [Lachnospiraceae bacterium]|nr:hypothetical protein [Lachnospiraceae bacterium]